MACGEHDWADQECDVAQQWVTSLQTKLGEERSRKLEAEATIFGLSTDLNQERAKL
jgi:hypothetical protein